MKRILITGKNSYIGNSFEKWLSKWPEQYSVDKISVRDNEWKILDWSVYDVVMNVAGIAHIKETDSNADNYYRVNRDLAIGIVEKAKKDKVSQILHISTMSVFGSKMEKISDQTVVKPNNNYGVSKLEADNYFMTLNSGEFQVSIIRPPMVYGVSSPGNFMKLYNFIKKVKAFPKIKNKRSMIYIDNLSECLKVIIDNKLEGYFYPQNNRYVNTFELASTISKSNNFKLIVLPNIFNWVGLLKKLVPTANKVFGDLYYDQGISRIYDRNNNQLNYNVVDFEESVRAFSNEA